MNMNKADYFKSQPCKAVCIVEGVSSGTTTNSKVTSKHDQYCWVCHMEGQKELKTESLWKCGNCIRVYHSKCVYMPKFPHPELLFKTGKDGKSEKIPSKLVKCAQCIVGENTTFDAVQNLPKERLEKILLYVCSKIKDMYEVNMFLDFSTAEDKKSYSKSVAKVVDIKAIKLMVKRGEIRTIEGFFGELKWMRHNTITFEGATSPLLDDVKEIMDFCLEEIKDLLNCSAWYWGFINRLPLGEIFMQPCDPPHILAWSKLSSFNWWPSKVTTIDEEQIGVIFFGDYMKSTISRKRCYIFSKNAPLKFPNHKAKAGGMTQGLVKALKEVETYIEAAEELYGPIKLAEDNTPMVSELTPEVIQSMYPGFRPSEQDNSVEKELSPHKDG